MKKPIITLMGIMMIGLVAGALEDGLIMYHDFSDTVDSVDGVYNITAINGSGLVSNGFIGGGANVTNGTANAGAYWNITGSETTFDWGAGAFTLNIWVNNTDKLGKENVYVINKHTDGAGGDGWYVVINNTDVFWRDDNGNEVIGGGNPGSYRHKWMMITVARSGANFRIYMNGTLLATGTPGNPPASGVSAIFGDDDKFGTTGVIDEAGAWNVRKHAAEILDLYNNGNGQTFDGFTFSGGQGVGVTLNRPTNNTFSISQIQFNASLQTTSTDYNLTNATLWIWNSAGIFNNTITNILTGLTNESIVNFNFSTENAYEWNVLGCAVNSSSDVFCNFDFPNRTISYGIINITSNFTGEIFETDVGYFNISFNSSVIPTAFLWWNGTRYSSTIDAFGGNNYRFSRDLDIPLEERGEKNLFWELIAGALRINTSVQTQTLSLTNVSLCGSPLTVPFINFSYVNETVAEESVTAFVSDSVFSIWLGTGNIRRNISYSSVSEVLSHGFCFTPAHRTANVDLYYSYDNSYSQQRTYNPNVLSLNNVTTNQSLFLLPTNDGIFVTFQVISQAFQTISNAQVTLEKSGTLISQTLTSSSGTTNVFLDPDTVYDLTVSATGFQTFTASQTFPTTEFTVQLGSTTSQQNNTLEGITYHIRPRFGTVLQNNTGYNFNFTINSTVWLLEEYGFTISNATAIVASNITSVDANNGFLSVDLNTGVNERLIMEYFWVVNGTSNNRSGFWVTGENEEGSILGFVQRLTAYVNDGIFGIQTFGIALIVFVVIFLVAGILTFRFGLTSGPVIAVAVLVFVIFIDQLGLLQNIGVFGANRLMTIIAGVLIVIIAIRGVTK